MSLDQSVKEYCKILSLPVVAGCYQKEAEAAAKAKTTYQEYLYRVLQQQVVVRVDNSVNTKTWVPQGCHEHIILGPPGANHESLFNDSN